MCQKPTTGSRKLYVLEHWNNWGKGNYDKKLLGVYSSQKKAEEAWGNRARESGFADEKENFYLIEVNLDAMYWIDEATGLRKDQR